MNAILDVVVIALVLFLIHLLLKCSGAQRASTILWTLNGVSFEGRDVKMNLRESEKVSGKFVGHKPDGTIGVVNGPVVVTLDPPDSLEVVLGADGTGEFELRGKTAAVPVPIAVLVNADVDPDPAVQKFLPATGSILLLPDISVVGELQFGTPEPK